jgi:molybdopterin synthase sulfur carrier subunit
MAIHVKFFASLRENLGIEQIELEPEHLENVRHVWAIATAGQPLPDSTLCAVNHQHCELDAAVKDGDEVAFFPPVTGG